MPDSPIPLDYRTPPPPKRPPGPPGALRRFFFGLGLGTAVSAVVWFPVWSMQGSNGVIAAVILIPLLKLLSGLPLLSHPRWRPLGQGILLSLVLGGMIFFSACSKYFKID